MSTMYLTKVLLYFIFSSALCGYGSSQNYTVEGEVQFDNINSGFCQPMVVNITLKFNESIDTVGRMFVIKTPGMTTGTCTSPNDGNNITDVAVQDDTYFYVNYYEGSWVNYYEDSYIRLETKQILNVNATYQLLFDRSNYIKRSCMKKNFFAVQEYCSSDECDTVTSTTDSNYLGSLNISNFDDENYKLCYAFSSELTFFPRYQKFPIEITLSLGLAFQMYPGDIIKLYLPGFTNSGKYLSNIDHSIASSVPGSEILTTVYWSTDFNWTNYWREGNFDSGYKESYVQFTMQDRHYPYLSDVPVFPERNGKFKLIIDRASQVSAYCGQHANHSGYALEIVSKDFKMLRTSIQVSDGIGAGCVAQNNCNGNGACNHCSSTCDCANGFGSLSDRETAVTDDFSPDCTSRTCPLGPAVRNSGRDAISVSTMHRLLECSNNGLCNRKNGTCTCFNGFGGAACEKMDCPGTPTCSGRGVCLPQQYLTIRPDALPLTNSTTTRYTHVTGDTSSGTSWDAKFGHACVCDSRWKVGLGANETQRAEYFGATCEYRRCPSGDNPLTLDVDETDCEGKSQIPGGANGTAGNLCHVDCSNQGICDYNTGLCACFPGFTSSNCGVKL